jgi:hypothetical protein
VEQAVTDHLVHVAQEAAELDRPVHRAHLQEVQLITAAVAQAVHSLAPSHLSEAMPEDQAAEEFQPFQRDLHPMA